jgi:hypothetical protein
MATYVREAKCINRATQSSEFRLSSSKCNSMASKSLDAAPYAASAAATDSSVEDDILHAYLNPAAIAYT